MVSVVAVSVYLCITPYSILIHQKLCQMKTNMKNIFLNKKLYIIKLNVHCILSNYHDRAHHSMALKKIYFKKYKHSHFMYQLKQKDEENTLNSYTCTCRHVLVWLHVHVLQLTVHTVDCPTTVDIIIQSTDICSRAFIMFKVFNQLNFETILVFKLQNQIYIHRQTCPFNSIHLQVQNVQ